MENKIPNEEIGILINVMLELGNSILVELKKADNDNTKINIEELKNILSVEKDYAETIIEKIDETYFFNDFFPKFSENIKEYDALVIKRFSDFMFNIYNEKKMEKNSHLNKIMNYYFIEFDIFRLQELEKRIQKISDENKKILNDKKIEIIFLSNTLLKDYINAKYNVDNLFIVPDEFLMADFNVTKENFINYKSKVICFYIQKISYECFNYKKETIEYDECLQTIKFNLAKLSQWQLQEIDKIYEALSKLDMPFVDVESNKLPKRLLVYTKFINVGYIIEKKETLISICEKAKDVKKMIKNQISVIRKAQPEPNEFTTAIDFSIFDDIAKLIKHENLLLSEYKNLIFTKITDDNIDAYIEKIKGIEKLQKEEFEIIMNLSNYALSFEENEEMLNMISNFAHYRLNNKQNFLYNDNITEKDFELIKNRIISLFPCFENETSIYIDDEKTYEVITKHISKCLIEYDKRENNNAVLNQKLKILFSNGFLSGDLIMSQFNMDNLFLKSEAVLGVMHRDYPAHKIEILYTYALLNLSELFDIEKKVTKEEVNFLIISLETAFKDLGRCEVKDIKNHYEEIKNKLSQVKTKRKKEIIKQVDKIFDRYDDYNNEFYSNYNLENEFEESFQLEFQATETLRELKQFLLAEQKICVCFDKLIQLEIDGNKDNNKYDNIINDLISCFEIEKKYIAILKSNASKKSMLYKVIENRSYIYCFDRKLTDIDDFDLLSEKIESRIFKLTDEIIIFNDIVEEFLEEEFLEEEFLEEELLEEEFDDIVEYDYDDFMEEYKNRLLELKSAAGIRKNIATVMAYRAQCYSKCLEAPVTNDFIKLKYDILVREPLLNITLLEKRFDLVDFIPAGEDLFLIDSLEIEIELAYETKKLAYETKRNNAFDIYSYYINNAKNYLEYLNEHQNAALFEYQSYDDKMNTLYIQTLHDSIDELQFELQEISKGKQKIKKK